MCTYRDGHRGREEGAGDTGQALLLLLLVVLLLPVALVVTYVLMQRVSVCAWEER